MPSKKDKSESLISPRQWSIWSVRPFLISVVAFGVICSILVVRWQQVDVESNTSSDTGDIPSLFDATLEQLSTGLAEGSFTSVDLVNAYVARIEEVHDLHSITEVNPDALAIAASLDDERRNGQTAGPLHGIPILIKNNIATMDKMNTTAGSFALLGAKVSQDSTMAIKLRKAGAIILGKTNLSQWAMWRSENTSNGWSAHGGQTYAAYHPDQDPSGSSSGSGVSISIGLALASLGTETTGSILCPSDASNLVGIKPTAGLTSRYLVLPISEHQDTVGPMARTVKDAAYLLSSIVGSDHKDNYTSAIPFHSHPDYVNACNRNSLAGVRIGVAWNVLELSSEPIDQPILDAFHTSIKQIEAAGATIVDANFTAFASFQDDDSWREVLSSDFTSNLEKYLSELTSNPNEVTDLASAQRWTHTQGSLEQYPERDTKLWDRALEEKYRNTNPSFWKAYQRNLYYGGEGGILGALERTNTTAILLPTARSHRIPGLVGSPVVTVPMGFYPRDWKVKMNGFGNLVSSGPNVPFGLSFMGAKWSEEKLIGYAYAYEQMTRHRDKVLPYIMPKTDLKDVVARRKSHELPEQRPLSGELK